MKKIERHHGLDGLRGTMLLLGLVVHASQGYFSAGELRAPGLWYFYDSTGSFLMAPLCGAIHVYRMPVFFVLAGFFAALLMTKRGLASMLVNRTKRVAAPLFVSLFTIVPLIYFSSEFAWAYRGGAPNGFGLRTGVAGMFTDNLYHLWFLWHLVILYAATAVVVPIARQFQKTDSPSMISAAINRLVDSNWGVFVFGTVSILFLAQMKTLPGGLDTSFGFFPPWYVLGIYGLCYLYGWVLFQNRQRLKRLGNNANTRMVIGVVAVTAYLVTLGWYLESGKPSSLELGLVILSAISIWTLVEAWLAMFEKYFNTDSRLARYVADSSYWVYLIHVPVVLVCQGLLANANHAAEMKFLITIALTTAICMLSYHLLVRATFVGQFLNGRRGRIWPSPESKATVVIFEVDTISELRSTGAGLTMASEQRNKAG